MLQEYDELVEITDKSITKLKEAKTHQEFQAEALRFKICCDNFDKCLDFMQKYSLKETLLKLDSKFLILKDIQCQRKKELAAKRKQMLDE